ncbi:MAG: ABC transporter ATP-binding protein [Proteobacteria bacterium]|nr:ABC transporter ATP-binding protein [Pseudomonadota bacterium]
MIEARNLTKRYGTRLALQDVSFHAERGEILGLLGPNGAGKSTTMRILTGYMPPSSGSARVAGFDVVDDSIDVRRRIGYMPENVPLYPEMTVRAYLDFVGRAKQVSNRGDAVEWAMDAARVDHMADAVIGRLSKGYKQRVGLAQAIIADPEVLVLDEPTAGLDPNQIIETRDLIRRLGQDRTIILSTHILPEVSMTCDRVVIVNRGQVIAEDTPAGLSQRLAGADRFTVTVRGPQDDVMAALSAIGGVAHVGLNYPGSGTGLSESIAASIVGRGWGLREMRRVNLSLEDVFLQLTTSEPEASEPREAVEPLAESEPAR